MKVLAGDLGGTKALLGITNGADFGVTAGVNSGAAPDFSFIRRYASADFPHLADLLAQFRCDAGVALESCVAACLAVAGPVADGGQHAQFTNLPWQADAASLTSLLGMPVTLVNDFAAVAAGIAVLPAEQRCTLQAGVPISAGVRLAVGAGTGLGVACIVPQDGRWIILPSEAGHIGYAPADAVQAEFAAFLRAEQGRATAERAISGMGLVSLYRFLTRRAGAADTPDPQLTADPAAAIGALALADPTSLARRAVDIFITSYGAFAGDLALALLARGGVFLAGGVTQKLLPLLQSGHFITAFNDKLEHVGLARKMPVYVITATDIGLLGAAVRAQQCASPSRAPIDQCQ